MTKGFCCGQDSNGTVAARSWAYAVGRALRWIVPGVVLATMPKCPLCLAAYVALFTGFGISLAAASFAWWFLAIGCIAALIYLVVATLHRYIKFE